MADPLTPETALAMAHAGAHNEPEHYCRYPSSVTVPAEQMAAEVIRRLLILGFEVRRKESGPTPTIIIHEEARADAAEADRDAWKARAEKAETALLTSDAYGLPNDLSRAKNELHEWREASEVLGMFGSPGAFRRRAAEVLAHHDEHHVREDKLESRATQAEAQAAAMRDMLIRYMPKESDPDRRAKMHVTLEKADAGRTLLVELEALRALEKTMRDARIAEWHSAADIEVDAAYFRCVQALAAVDAARKGE